MVEQHSLWEVPIHLGLDFDVNEHQLLLAGQQGYFHQSVGEALAVFGLAADGQEFGIQQLVAGRPVDIRLDIGKEESEELLEILAEGIFPGRTV